MYGMCVYPNECIYRRSSEQLLYFDQLLQYHIELRVHLGYVLQMVVDTGVNQNKSYILTKRSFPEVSQFELHA